MNSPSPAELSLQRPVRLRYTESATSARSLMSLPTIKLLVTDLDNTLYDWVGFFASAFSAMVDTALPILGVARDTLLNELQIVHRRHRDSEHPWSLVETRCAIERWPRADRAERKRLLDPAFHAFNRVRKARLTLYPGVQDTLATLHASGVPIFGHTEASTVSAVDRVQRLGLASFLDRLYAADVGVPVTGAPLDVVPVPREIHKPDPRVLSEICTGFGIAPEQALYVGDSISRDVGMAQQIGMHTAWAAYGTRHRAEDWATLVRVTHWSAEDVERVATARERFGTCEPDASIESFAELLEHFEFVGAGVMTRTA